MDLDALLSDGVLKALEDEGRRPVQKIFEITYLGLGELAARAYSALSLLPGVDFSAELASHVLGWNADDTNRVLRELTAGYILHHNDGRYRFHNLVREHALECAAAALPESEQAALVAAAWDWYLKFGVSHDKVISRLRPYPVPAESHYEQIPPAHDEVERAYAEFAIEWPNITAAARSVQSAGTDKLSVVFPMPLWTFGYQTRRIVELIDLYETALRCTTDDLQLWQLYRDLAGLHEGNGDMRAAEECIERAFEQNYPAGRASLWEWRGLAAEGRGDLLSALSCFEKAREAVPLMREDHQKRARALLDMHSGRVLAAVGGRDDEAAVYAEEARQYFSGIPDEALNHALSRVVLGRIFAKRDQDITMLREALDGLDSLTINDRAAGIAAELAQWCDAAGRVDEAAEYRRREQELDDRDR